MVLLTIKFVVCNYVCNTVTRSSKLKGYIHVLHVSFNRNVRLINFNVWSSDVTACLIFVYCV